MVKRVLILVIVVAMGFSTTSCGGGEGSIDTDGGIQNPNPKPPDPPQPDPSDPPSADPSDPPSADPSDPPTPPLIDKLVLSFGYAQLSDDAESKFYRHLFDTLSDYQYETGEHLKLHYYDIYAKGHRITKASLQRVLGRLIDDHPKLFHLGNIVPWRYREGYLGELKINFFYNRSDYDGMLSAVVVKADNILECVTVGMSEYSKAKAIHDTFLANVSYGMSLGNEGSVYGALVGGKVVCEGYARGLQYLYQKAGLQALYVQGAVKSSDKWIMHAWIIVRIDGVYYYVDPTWDDSIAPGSVGCHWDYFLKSSAYMQSKGYYPMQDPDFPESQMGFDPDAFRQSVACMTVLPACNNNY